MNRVGVLSLVGDTSSIGMFRKCMHVVPGKADATASAASSS
jgi:hypothetical protein